MKRALPGFLLLLAASPAAAADCDLESAEFYTQATEQQVNRCLDDLRKTRSLYMGLGGSPLHWAASFTSSPEVIEQLLAAGADVDLRIERQVTPLHRAALNNTEPAVIAALLAAGADVGSRDEQQATPLHNAAYNNSEPKVIEVLLAAGADISSRTDYGITPLHWAALNNPHPAMIETLLAAGADPTLVDDGGSTAWDYLQDNENLEELRDTDAYRRLSQHR